VASQAARPLAAAPPAHPAPLAAGLVGAVLCILAVAQVVDGAPQDERLERALLVGLAVAVPMGVGAYATRSPQHFRFGWMLMVAAAAWSLTALAESDDSVPYSIGRVAAWLVFPALFYLMLAFPQGRVAAGFDRRLLLSLDALLALLYVGSALFVSAYPRHTPWTSCDGDCPPNAFLILDREPGVISTVALPVREALSVALLAALTWSLARRVHRMSRLQRRSIVPVTLMSGVSCVVLAAYFPVRRAAPDSWAVEALGTAWALCIPAIAAALLVGLMRRRLVVAGALQRLSLALTRDLDAGGLRRALANALDDPAFEVLVPDEAPGRWRDSRGEPASTSAVAADRAVTRVEDRGAPLAALVHERALSYQDDLLGPIASLVGTALRHERVKANLARSLSDLEASRHRIARVADLERARIERDLHDGAQQHLIMLRVKLSLAEELVRTDPAAGARALGELGEEVEHVLEELRLLAHGVYPPLLSDRGLEDALRSILATSPVPVELSVRGVGRHSREIESAVYFTGLEAFQNALKHATGATRLWISMREGDVMKLEVRDDGSGFVPDGMEDRGGLRNMRDRLEAVGGTLVIDSAPGHGTRVRGTVPIENGTSPGDP
jgi:signal transduction histidine kinase